MIAVTGANGLLGSFIVKKFAEKSIPVAAIVRRNSAIDLGLNYAERISWRQADILNVIALTEALEGVGVVIHTAAAVSFNPRQSKKVFEVNVEGTRNVVDVCLALGIPKIIHVSSIAALGRQKGTLTVDEESKWIDNTAGSYYAESKYQAEAEIFRGQEEGLSVSMVIPSAILGPSDWTKSSSQVFRYVWRRGSFYTEGTFNYVDVRDVADMIFELFQGDYAGQKFIATAGSTSLKNLLEEIALRFNKKAPSIKLNGFWVWTISRLEAIRSLLLGTEPLITRESAKFALESFQYSNQKAKDVLRFKFRTIEETLDWCCTEYLHNINTKK